MASWTHLIRFIAVEDGLIHLGQVIDTTRDVGLDIADGRDVQAYHVDGSIFDAEVTAKILTVKTLLSPIAKEQCPYIRCIGMNYADHAKEIDIELPKAPSMFTKPRTTLANPFPAPLLVPKLSQDASSDYEAELCIVIGKEGRNITEDSALQHVLGYTAANDVSSRKLQMADQQWSFSKGFDGSCPMGPVLVAPSVIADPQKLKVQSLYNEKIVQDGTTSDMIFGAAKLISFLSQSTTLEAGSIILTGTPKGVGFKSEPRIFLEDGADMRVHIEGIGTLMNRVAYADW